MILVGVSLIALKYLMGERGRERGGGREGGGREDMVTSHTYVRRFLKRRWSS